MKTGWLLALLCLPACLELNPEFVAGDETSGSSSDASESSTVGETAAQGTGGGDSSSGGDPSGGSSSGAAACVADDLEPNEAMDEASNADDLGFVLSATVDSAFDVDWYKGISNPDAAGELYVRATPLAFRTCIYIVCKSTVELPTIDKCSGVLDTASSGEPGCCGPGVASIEYTCAEGLDVEFHARVDDPAAAECAPYEVEFGTI